ncbi:MAG TPA: cupin domain-containing protein [Dongiaceae bacterium]|nr:cupin domain-containing protein [Dongiaceae bacterium]
MDKLMEIEVIDLIGRAGALPPDREEVAGAGLVGDLLLIRLEPGDYPIECHDGRIEIITALRGNFGIATEDGRLWSIGQGQCCRIPPGLRHCWTTDSDATVLVAFIKA